MKSLNDIKFEKYNTKMTEQQILDALEMGAELKIRYFGDKPDYSFSFHNKSTGDVSIINHDHISGHTLNAMHRKKLVVKSLQSVTLPKNRKKKSQEPTKDNQQDGYPSLPTNIHITKKILQDGLLNKGWTLISMGGTLVGATIYDKNGKQIAETGVERNYYNWKKYAGELTEPVKTDRYTLEYKVEPTKDNQNEIEGLKILLKDAKGDDKKAIQKVIDEMSGKKTNKLTKIISEINKYGRVHITPSISVRKNKPEWGMNYVYEMSTIGNEKDYGGFKTKTTKYKTESGLLKAIQKVIDEMSEKKKKPSKIKSTKISQGKYKVTKGTDVLGYIWHDPTRDLWYIADELFSNNAAVENTKWQAMLHFKD
jgi:hypothetical protein